MTNDPEIWQTARQKLPLPLLMTKLGDGQFTKPKAPCPFCGAEKGKWAVFERAGKHYFKCHAPECVGNENEAGHGEIAYIMLRKEMSSKEAGKEFLRLAVPELVPLLFETAAPAPRKPKAASHELGAPDEPDEPDEIPGLPPPPTQPPPRDTAARNPWHSFWQKIPLTIADRTLLQEKRGFSPETIEELGFRSNNASNLQHLQSLASEYTMDELIAEGIFKEEGTRGIRPSGQLHGWGRTDEVDPKSKKAIYKQTEPIIIPYLDADGVPFYLRPHKGGVKKPKDELEDIELWETDDEGQTCASHVYCPYLLVEMIHLNDGLVVLTEGEYKAAALWQCGIAAIACPGIQFVANKAFRDELVGILQKFGVTDLVVIFDNEVKDDPSFPKRYKADPWKRWDTPMWAEYTARALRDYFVSRRGSCRIGWLPNDMRTDGKIDCDGVLAQMVHKHGLEEGTRMARKVFIRTIEDASEKPDADLFSSESRRIIECKLERLFYKHLVPMGGEKEITLARRFSEYDLTGNQVHKPLAEAFRSLRGCYYERQKPVKDQIASLLKEKDEIQKQIDEIKATKADTKEWERHSKAKLRFLYSHLAAKWELLKGVPKPISNFTLSCEYKLHTQTGDVHRLIDIRDSKERTKANGKEKEMHRIPPKSLARLAEFREFVYATGKGVFHGGEKDLQYLVQDMDHHSYLRDIHEITTYGYHPDSKIWFFGDIAFDPNGKVIMPDAANIFWYDGIGYQVDQSTTDRGSSFVQFAPLLTTPQGPVAKIENPNVAAIFRQFSEDLWNTIGSFEGWMIMGLVAAYAVAPELLRVFGGHPGLWLFGKMSSGKTTVARWALRVWGFRELGGIRMGDSTSPTAMNRFLAQYSNLPVWIDEYRRLSVDAQREEVLRGSFDRSSGAKGIADHSNKTRNATILTTPIVSGESSSGDAATRSRFGHVAVSIHNRVPDGAERFNRVQSEAHHFYHLGYWLMTNRKEFAERTMKFLSEWMLDQTVRSQIVNERVRLVHGTAMAAFYTMADMLGFEKSIEVPAPADVDEDPDRTASRIAIQRINQFQSFLFSHGNQALQDVIEETFLNQFWRDVIAAVQLQAIKACFLVTRYVKRDKDGRLTECEAEDSNADHVCYVAADPVFAAYQQFKAVRHEAAPQGISDIRRELEKEPYWIAPPTGACRVHRISIKGHKTSCWVISLNRKPGEQGKPGPFLFPFAEEIDNVLNEEPNVGQPA